MDSGRVSSMAQLSTWTETMKNSKQSAVGSKSTPLVDDDEYEEEFEDYEEEFEEEETPPIAPSKQTQVPFATNSRQPLVVNDKFAVDSQKRLQDFLIVKLINSCYC